MQSAAAQIFALENNAWEADRMALKCPFSTDRKRLTDLAVEYRARAQKLRVEVLRP